MTEHQHRRGDAESAANPYFGSQALAKSHTSTEAPVSELRLLLNAICDTFQDVSSSYVSGRNDIGQSIKQKLNCSAIQAERYVSLMEQQDLIQFWTPAPGDAEMRSKWIANV